MNEDKYHLSTPMGIHRVMKEPYDDREVFESMNDLWDYCKNGARYNGQKVACIIGTPGENKGYVQNFTICQDFPIINLNNGEIVIDKDKGILVYNYNAFALNDDDKIMCDDDKTHYNYLSNPNKFSILSLIKAFKECNQDTFLITIDKYTNNSANYISSKFEIPTDAFEQVMNESIEYNYSIDNSTINITIAKELDNCEIYIKYEKTIPGRDPIIREYNIIPKDDEENTCTRIYIKPNGYITAIGEG